MSQQEKVRVLGCDARGPITAEQPDVAPWSHGNTDAVVEFTTNELTSFLSRDGAQRIVTEYPQRGTCFVRTRSQTAV